MREGVAQWLEEGEGKKHLPHTCTDPASRDPPSAGDLQVPNISHFPFGGLRVGSDGVAPGKITPC